ncbi:DUF4136 domain-containing protein [Shewanella intestini]|uniref:DUF4136 domain-containing protein n=1 Tax=Shewanella intestini TaxID=2017544 RepID=A0ABS5HYC5_9GAMM|nr:MULTISPECIES: DUF4136 domain-containing protein [Shewanella]MBR9726419.1 DUF4136 domain-containing protein [Shewanella intestini]MRG35015.1 DUF4136 domain-containing protein [Shewanella sp. XMDDZSB0408]
MKHHLRVTLSQLLGIILFFTLAGCVSAPKIDYDINYDFSKLTTYQFLSQTEKTQQADPLTASRVKAAIEQVLNGQGYQAILNSSDFTVNYRLLTTEKPKSSGLSIGLGTGSSGRNGSIGIGTSVGVPIGNDTVTEQQVQIDIIDSQTNKLIWRGAAPLKLTKGGEAKVEATTNTVKHILSAFPPQNVPSKQSN